MKKIYNEVKSWVFENGVEVKEKDVVKVTFDLKPYEVSSSFLENHPNNEVILYISKINSRVIEGEIYDNPCNYLYLYPKNILDITLCDNPQELYPHRFSKAMEEEIDEMEL